ncbi:MAG: hypothetical protein Q8882_00525 [Bacillota bacterium]|nr:hypothetical protein [Bacillota bacterium]
MSRIENSARNLSASAVRGILVIILNFITRTVFINVLGKRYLGISDLFTNVISVLSLAELGIGSAIVFNLYKPIAEKDIPQIRLLVKFYRTCYQFIGYFILAVGLCLMPFLKYIIKDDVSFINANLIFSLYLIRTVFSYLFFAYKTSLLTASQQEYKLTIISTVFAVISNLAQIAVLVLFKNFTLYVFIVILITILQNFVGARQTDKEYPFIKEKVDDKLTKEERKEIFKNCYALVIYNINEVVVNATDNIVLSTFIGLEIVGMYSNYVILYGAIKDILQKLYNAMIPSIGNLHAEGDVEHEHKLFNSLNFMTSFLFGIGAVGFAVVGNELIHIWIGDKYIIDQSFAVIMAVNLYITGMDKILSVFRNAMGLFQQAKYRPLAGIIINLVFSIIAVRYMGVHGVVLGTIVANVTTFMWYDPYIIYREVFKRSAWEYYKKNIQYGLLVIACGVLSYYICNLIGGINLGYLLLHSIICVIITGGAFYAIYGRTEDFKYIINMAKHVLKKIFKKFRRKQPEV